MHVLPSFDLTLPRLSPYIESYLKAIRIPQTNPPFKERCSYLVLTLRCERSLNEG